MTLGVQAKKTAPVTKPASAKTPSSPTKNAPKAAPTAKSASPSKLPTRGKAAAKAPSKASAGKGGVQDEGKSTQDKKGMAGDATGAHSEAIAVQATEAPASAPQEGADGAVVVRYNHYKSAFPIKGGVLRWADVDDEYAISFVFKGSFGRSIIDSATKEAVVQEGAEYMGLVPGGDYRLVVAEDESAQNGVDGLTKAGKAYKAPGGGGLVGRVVGSGDDGESMFADNSGCSCLYGNPCISAYNCQDWNNRFEVAKRNGWKGHS